MTYTEFISKISETTKAGMADPELRAKLSKKKSLANTGCKWYTDGVNDYFRKTCHENCWLGRSKYSRGNK